MMPCAIYAPSRDIPQMSLEYMSMAGKLDRPASHVVKGAIAGGYTEA